VCVCVCFACFRHAGEHLQSVCVCVCVLHVSDMLGSICNPCVCVCVCGDGFALLMEGSLFSVDSTVFLRRLLK